jgi:hypothetical protein
MIREYADRFCARVSRANGFASIRPSLKLVVACFVLSATVPAHAENGMDDRNGGQVQMISLEEFQAMVKAGMLIPVNHESREDERWAIEKANRANKDVVEDFLRRNPDLTDLARLVNVEPDLDDDPDHDHDRDHHRQGNQRVRRWGDDSYALTVVDHRGLEQTFETMGHENKLFQLAHSILTLSDPVAQSQLYATLYSQLPADFCNPNNFNNLAPSAISNGGCAGLPLPASLRDASLETIQTALQALTVQTSNIILHTPIPIHFEPTGCAAEIGSNLSPEANVGAWGDMTQSTGCPGPSPTGIYANFNFPNKNLLSCVRNQGQRGTCHIFAAVSGIEELIAEDSGGKTKVNLNEQDFQEHVKLIWSPNAPVLYNDNGSSWWDLTYAISNNYNFAYENRWDYNPSLSQTETPTAFFNSCLNYPSTEPGCSNTAPQAPERCALEPHGLVCGYLTATLPSYTNYGASSVVDVWNAQNTGLTFDYMILGLAFGDAVMVGFSVTDDFQGAPGGYIPYLASDLNTSVGGHQVHVVGFVGNAELATTIPSAPPGAGGGYFIIKNSWSTCLGDAGYWYMPVSYLLAQANEVDLVSTFTIGGVVH